MRARPVLVLAVLPAVLVAGAAVAAPAPKPVCNLVTDAAGDASVVTGAADMDIVRADLASDGRRITALLKLASDPTAVNPQAPGGKSYYVSFTAPGSTSPQFLSASFDPLLGASYGTGFTEDVNGVGSSTSDAAPASGKVTGTTITITAPLSAFARRVSLRPGKKLTALTAETFALVGTGLTGGLLVAADDATGGSYTTGSPSCVKVGS